MLSRNSGLSTFRKRAKREREQRGMVKQKSREAEQKATSYLSLVCEKYFPYRGCEWRGRKRRNWEREREPKEFHNFMNIFAFGLSCLSWIQLHSEYNYVNKNVFVYKTLIAHHITKATGKQQEWQNNEETEKKDTIIIVIFIFYYIRTCDATGCVGIWCCMLSNSNVLLLFLLERLAWLCIDSAKIKAPSKW